MTDRCFSPIIADLFNISEVTLHSGEVKDADYFLTADVMDAVSNLTSSTG